MRSRLRTRPPLCSKDGGQGCSGRWVQTGPDLHAHSPLQTYSLHRPASLGPCWSFPFLSAANRHVLCQPRPPPGSRPLFHSASCLRCSQPTGAFTLGCF